MRKVGQWKQGEEQPLVGYGVVVCDLRINTVVLKNEQMAEIVIG